MDGLSKQIGDHGRRLKAAEGVAEGAAAVAADASIDAASAKVGVETLREQVGDHGRRLAAAEGVAEGAAAVAADASARVDKLSLHVHLQSMPVGISLEELAVLLDEGARASLLERCAGSMRVCKEREATQLASCGGSVASLLAWSLSLLHPTEQLRFDEQLLEIAACLKDESMDHDNLPVDLPDALRSVAHTHFEIVDMEVMACAALLARTVEPLREWRIHAGPAKKPQLLILLDMDETLTHTICVGENSYLIDEPATSQCALERCDFIAHSDDLFFCVMARPYLSTLVTFLKQLKVELQDQIELEFGVFTAGAADYANCLLDALKMHWPDAEIFDQRICGDELARLDPDDRIGYKDLRVVGRKLTDVVLFDNSPWVCLQPENVGAMRSFTNDKNDVELLRLCLVAERLARAKIADRTGFDAPKVLVEANFSLAAVTTMVLDQTKASATTTITAAAAEPAVVVADVSDEVPAAPSSAEATEEPAAAPVPKKSAKERAVQDLSNNADLRNMR